jgi:hypothetical protein
MIGYYKQCACGAYADNDPCYDCLEAENERLKAEIVRLSGGEQDHISDQKKKRLFKGNALDYVRHRAHKFEMVYGNPKQAQHLRRLASKMEDRLDAQAKVIEAVRVLRTAQEAWNAFLNGSGPDTAKHEEQLQINLNIAWIDIGAALAEHKTLEQNSNRCDHKNTHPVTDIPMTDEIEVCNDCGMSRSIWEQGESDWMVVNLEQLRLEMQLHQLSEAAKPFANFRETQKDYEKLRAALKQINGGTDGD